MHKPTGMSYEEAAAVCDGASQALASLRLAGATEGRRLLIYGASGSLGTAAIQLAKHYGAHVTAVCGTAHLELVRSLGADDVVDYRAEDFTKRGVTYDAIVDAVGKYSPRRGRHALVPGGIYVATHVDVIPPRKDDGVAALKRLGEDSRRDHDNLRFEVVQQISRPNHFTVVEIWRDAKAVETHSMAAPTREFRDKLATMTGALYDERLYRAID